MDNEIQGHTNMQLGTPIWIKAQHPQTVNRQDQRQVLAAQHPEGASRHQEELEVVRCIGAWSVTSTVLADATRCFEQG